MPQSPLRSRREKMRARERGIRVGRAERGQDMNGLRVKRAVHVYCDVCGGPVRCLLGRER